MARSGAGMVYQNMLIDSNIWELPTPASPNRQPSGDATFRLIASTSADTDMRFSPDGTESYSLSQVGPLRVVGVEPRRITGDTADTLRGQRAGGEALAGLPTASGSRSTRY